MRNVLLGLLTVVTLAACSADIPNGVIVCEFDNACPTGFVCRSEPVKSGPPFFCFDHGVSETGPGGAGGSGGMGGSGGSGGGTSGSGGSGENMDAGRDDASTDSGMDASDADTGVPNCDEAACDQHASCDAPNGTCVCEVGYEGSGTACTKVPQCEDAPNGGCDTDPMVTCRPGSTPNDERTCPCPGLYSGDGIGESGCTMGNPCETDNGGCGSASAWTCTHNPGAAPTCTNRIECTDGNDNCDANATCTDTEGSFTCDCNPGYVGDGTSCTLCGAGTYENNNTCVDCGTISRCDVVETCNVVDGTGLTCPTCDPGYVGDGTGACTPCGTGTYENNNTCVDCGTVDSCALTETCNVINGTSLVCPTCDPGYVGDSTASCTACGSGTYDNNNTCTTCPQVTNCATNSTETCNVTTGTASICPTCAAGYVGDGTGTCAACPTGQWDNNETCTDCGTIANCTATETCNPATGGSDVCPTCAAGYRGNGTATCTACTAISNCASGLTCTTNSDQTCGTCAAGYVGDGTGMCTACGTGTWASNNACVDCGTIANCNAVETCNAANGANDVCPTCAAGYVGDGTGACTPCGAGTWESNNACTDCGTIANCNAVETCNVTTGANDICPTCAAGFRGNGTGACTACTAIANCASGLTCTTPSNQTCGTCAAGYYGNGTAACTPIPAPRPVGPLSISTVTGPRPTLRWALVAGATGARVEICSNRACSSVITTFDFTGSSGTPNSNLAVGRVYWRLKGRNGSSVGTASSPVWSFIVPNRTTTPTPLASWGTEPDFNADGFADIAVGASGANSGAGVFHVFASPISAGATTSETLTVTRPVGQTTPSFAAHVRSAPDINGDGLPDLLVGTSGAGFAYVYLGTTATASHVSASPLVLTAPSNPNYANCFGSAIAGVGDVNGDGYGDIVVGGYGCTNGALLYFGSPSGIDNTPDQRLIAGNVTVHFATAIAAGDINGDGFADVAVSDTAQANDSIPSAFHIYGGSSSGVGTGMTPVRSPHQTQVVSNQLRQFGKHLSFLDADSDGYADLSVLHYSWQDPGTSVVEIFRSNGAGTVDADSLDTNAVPLSPAAVLDMAVAIGDVNRDGHEDLFVANPSHGDPNRRGRGYVYLGPVADQPSPQTIDYPGTPADDSSAYFGVSALGGDVDGDGFSDLVVGSYGVNTRGAAYVFRGESSLCGQVGCAPERTLVVTDAATTTYFGTSISTGR